MTLFFESDFVDGIVKIDPLTDPYLEGSGEVSIVDTPYYSWPYAGYALVKADPAVVNYFSQRAAFAVYVGDPAAKPNLYARAYFLRTTELPLDTDHMMEGQDTAGGDNNWNWASLINLDGACSIRLHQNQGVDPPTYAWVLVLAYNDLGTIKFLNSYLAWDNWPVGIWKGLEIHWVRDAVNGGAEVFFDGVKVHEVWGYDTANLPGRDPGDYGGVRYVHFGALTATQRYKDFGVVVDNIKIADTFTGIEDPTLPPVILNYTSTPIEIEAVINGVLVPSGSSLEFDQGSTVNIEAPTLIAPYLFSHFLVNGEAMGTPTISITMLADINVQAVYTLEVVRVTLNYASSPIMVDALVNGTAVASGSSIELDQGSVITISVPKEVEVP